MDIRVITADETLALRHKVLWPHMDREFCRVEGDEEALHYGVYRDNELICTASFFTEGKSVRLRKFATDPAFQGRGIGSFLIRYVLDILKNQGITHFWCDARLFASGFYSRFGMIPKGEAFYKKDVKYIVMEKFL